MQSYTILESSTDSLFVYMTIQDGPGGYGSILKSNSNGTYFGVSVDNVNRDSAGYVDFEKMIGIDGVGLINVVANAKEAVLSGRKTIQTKITHNDGQLSFYTSDHRLLISCRRYLEVHEPAGSRFERAEVRMRGKDELQPSRPRLYRTL